MSLESQTSVDTLTIRRLGPTAKDAANAPTKTYTTAARGDLPTEILARALPMSAAEARRLGVEGSAVAWKFLVSVEDPQVRGDDVIDFTDASGVEHTDIEVLAPSIDLAGLGRLWRFDGVERSTVR